MSHYRCPVCTGASSVIETRVSYSRLRRRRSCAEGHRFTTVEVPHDTAKKLHELAAWLCKQGLDSEVADYARGQITSILHGSSEDNED